MEEKEPTTRENPSPDDDPTVLDGHRPAGHIAPGSKVGDYTIREVLGEGGFAVVYLAEQTEPVRRRVALKVIKLGMDTKQVLARFEAERQALAMMDHPCVAKVFDAGVTDDGRSYFVMEHVPGIPITEHCDRQRLNIEQRLALFTQVCEAVQHAHQKGIIHRDLKPSNVLVSAKDGGAVPKVIDFGVAKALHQKLTEKTLFTEQGQLIGTPEYMSPEQAEMTAQDIDTRSDIYSLGVLLYELLTGALPFDPTTLRKAAFGEIQRIIREEEPPKPSTRLSSLGDESTTYAQKRRADPRSLLRELRGDLDWITMKALEKDRTRRYETANGLAMDIQRHLDHEAVLASPPSATYKLSKFVRRNRTGVIASAVVAAALVVATVVSIGFAFSEAEQRRIADAEAKRADEEARKAVQEKEIAQAVNEFLNKDLLAAVAPSAEEGKGKDVLMRDVLDEAAKRIEEASTPGGRFEDKPLIEASIRQTLGFTYRELGEYPAAEPHLERARELRRRELGEEHPQTLASMMILGNLYSEQGRYDEAERLHLETLGIQKRVLGEDHPHTLGSMNNLANEYKNQGRYDDAEPVYLETLERMRRVLGEEASFTLNCMGNLALLYMNQGRYDEAEALYLKTLEIRKRLLGEEHPSTLGSMNNLAILYKQHGRYDEAEPLYLETLEIKKRVLGEEHPNTLASMGGLAGLYADQGRHGEAEPLYVKTLEIQKRVLGEEHPKTLASMGNLANMYDRLGRYAEAEPLHLKTLEIKKRVLGDEHPSTLASITNLGNLYLSMKRFDDARTMFERSLPIKRRVLGMGHPWTRYALRGLARAYDGLDRGDEAELLYLETLNLEKRVLGDEHPHTLDSMHTLAILYDGQGRYDEALPLWRELQEIQLAQAKDPYASAQVLNAAAWDLLTIEHAELRDPARALPLAQRAVDKAGGVDPGILDTLALAQFMTGDITAAIETEKKALSLLPADAPLRGDCEAALARFEAALEDASK